MTREEIIKNGRIKCEGKCFIIYHMDDLFLSGLYSTGDHEDDLILHSKFTLEIALLSSSGFSDEEIMKEHGYPLPAIQDAKRHVGLTKAIVDDVPKYPWEVNGGGVKEMFFITQDHRVTDMNGDPLFQLWEDKDEEFKRG